MLPFSKKLCFIETSQSICKVDQFTEFYMIKVFTKRYFRTDYTILLLKPKKADQCQVYSQIKVVWVMQGPFTKVVNFLDELKVISLCFFAVSRSNYHIYSRFLVSSKNSSIKGSLNLSSLCTPQVNLCFLDIFKISI